MIHIITTNTRFYEALIIIICIISTMNSIIRMIIIYYYYCYYYYYDWRCRNNINTKCTESTEHKIKIGSLIQAEINKT